MQITKHKVVTIDYTLKDDAGEVIDSSAGGESLAYLHGANNLIPGLESALEGKAKGEELSVRVAPKDAYGERDDSLRQAVPRDMFGDEDVQVGAQYHAAGPNGEQLVVTVVGTNADEVTVDGNHPLAGVPLNFDVTVLDVRNATDEEISHGHVHGAGGHHHG
jgi:FKBP-type peptidyl-prolyl cis-trans isomerase SlyD